MHNDAKNMSFLEEVEVLADFLEIDQGKKKELIGLVSSGKEEEAANILYERLQKYLDDLKGSGEAELLEIDKEDDSLFVEESAIDQSFDKEYDDFYKERYDKLDEQIEEDYQSTMYKLEDLDHRVRRAIKNIFQDRIKEEDDQKIENIRKIIGKN
jgi:hypothetical protein